MHSIGDCVFSQCVSLIKRTRWLFIETISMNNNLRWMCMQRYFQSQSVMDYVLTRKKWSTCSVEDFQAYYSSFDEFCLKEPSDRPGYQVLALTRNWCKSKPTILVFIGNCRSNPQILHFCVDYFCPNSVNTQMSQKSPIKVDNCGGWRKCFVPTLNNKSIIE